MKLHFFIYVVIIGLVLNLLANMIWKYLPGTDQHFDKILTVILVAICVILLVSYKEKDTNPDIKGTQIVVSGESNVEIGSIYTDNKIGQLIINNSDSEEIKKQKIIQAKNLIKNEVLKSIVSIDARLSCVNKLYDNDAFEEKLKNIRQKVIPSTQEMAAIGYSRLIAENRISSLRQSINSYPLQTELREVFIRLLLESNINSKAYNSFYNQLAEVEWATESLFNILSESTRERAEPSIWQDYYNKRLSLGIESLQQRSNGAYLLGIQALHTLGIKPNSIFESLNNLKNINTVNLSDFSLLPSLIRNNIDHLEKIVLQKAELKNEGKRLLEEDLKKWDLLNNRLVINPDDTWNEVAGKAITLRQFGRVTEAVAAFYKYSQMFSNADPVAEQYSKTAMAFTQNCKRFNVKGGVYLYQMLDNGAAKEANLSVGDIIIEYNGKTIEGMDDILSVLRDTPEGEIIRITYLRLDQKSGRFSRHNVSSNSGALGAGMMPI